MEWRGSPRSKPAWLRIRIGHSIWRLANQSVCACMDFIPFAEPKRDAATHYVEHLVKMTLVYQRVLVLTGQYCSTVLFAAGPEFWACQKTTFYLREHWWPSTPGPLRGYPFLWAHVEFSLQHQPFYLPHTWSSCTPASYKSFKVSSNHIASKHCL